MRAVKLKNISYVMTGIGLLLTAFLFLYPCDNVAACICCATYAAAFIFLRIVGVEEKYLPGLTVYLVWQTVYNLIACGLLAAGITNLYAEEWLYGVQYLVPLVIIVKRA